MAQAQFLGTYSVRGTLDEKENKVIRGQRKQYWFVWQDVAAKSYLVQRLDSASFDPIGDPRLLPSNTFRQSFSREPHVTVLPVIQPDVADYIGKAFGSGKAEKITLVSGSPGAPATPAGARDTAPPPPNPEVVDKNLRAAFAKGVMRLRRGDREIALREFQRLAAVTEGIIPAHKHMFTDFGVDLRKSRLPEQALQHFQRAVDLSPDDSHARFNIGRIYYELGKYRQAAAHLQKALDLEPDMTEAQKLLARIPARARD